MNTFIEIHDNNTNETGTHKVWYKDLSGKKQVRVLPENYVNSLLEVSQKEDFFMGKYRFKVKSEYDFRTIVLEGQRIEAFEPKTNTTIIDAISSFYENR